MDGGGWNIMHHLYTGRLGEELAAEYLIKKGFTLIERNFRKPWGEIDIIMKDPKGVLVFIEVKTILRHTQDKLRQSFGNAQDKPGNNNEAISPEDNLTKSKLTKVKRTAQLYVGHYPEYLYKNVGWRVDLVAIIMPETLPTLAKEIRVKHSWMFHVKRFLSFEPIFVHDVSHLERETLAHSANPSTLMVSDPMDSGSMPNNNSNGALTNLLKISLINHYENL
ncbi:MAG: YraN family protein [bacterium]|nr:YraN family protein [bacterium]